MSNAHTSRISIVDLAAKKKAGQKWAMLTCYEQITAQITNELSIPTIGIGAGVNCDAQVLVWTDLMGMTAKMPKLAKAYRNLRKEMTDAVGEFAQDVAAGRFPTADQSFN